MRAVILSLIATLALYGAAFAADPAGHYAVKGTNPGGSGAYAGNVTVKKTGETYSVVWTIDGTKYVGTGVGNDEFLTVSYKSGATTGVALYGHNATGWSGVWAYAGGTQLGTETWAAE